MARISHLKSSNKKIYRLTAYNALTEKKVSKLQKLMAVV